MPHTIKTLVYLELRDDRETPKAYAFLFEKGKALVFLPKDYVEDIRETSHEVDIPLWLVDKADLEDYVI